MADNGLPQFKACTKCGQTKEIGEFVRRAARRGPAVQSWCRQCTRQLSRDRRDQYRIGREASRRAWEAANHDKRQAITARRRVKVKATPRGRVAANVGRAVNRALHSGMGERHIFGIFGYTPDELRLHLERQFTKDMSWDNYGRHGWHIDHIVPLSSFNYDSPDHPEFKKAWALTNLRPLWADQNLRKSWKRLLLV